MVWEFFDKITGEFNYKPDEVSQLSPLVLAYIGDAVYEVFIRTMLVSGGNVPVHVLHKRSIAYVKAKAQSDIVHRIMPLLTEEELNIVRREGTPNRPRFRKMRILRITGMLPVLSLVGFSLFEKRL